MVSNEKKRRKGFRLNRVMGKVHKKLLHFSNDKQKVTSNVLLFFLRICRDTHITNMFHIVEDMIHSTYILLHLSIIHEEFIAIAQLIEKIVVVQFSSSFYLTIGEFFNKISIKSH